MLRLYFFSGTGNSLWAAREIASRLGDGELISIPGCDASKENISADDTVGIVFPTYAWGPPRMVAEFLTALKIPSGTYTFALATYASSPGASLPMVSGILKKNGAILSAGFGISLPSNYTPFGGAWEQDRQQKSFETASAFFDDLAAAVKSRLEQNGPSFPAIFVPVVKFFNKFSVKEFRKMSSKFSVGEMCNGCGICAKVCLAENIEMQNGKPQWLDKCEQCLACLHWCPKTAIELGRISKGRLRYTNPFVKSSDLGVKQKHGNTADVK